MSADASAAQCFGPQRLADGRTRFSLWAPACREVSLLTADGRVAMRREADGWFAVEHACAPGARYRFALDDGFLVPDPASRFQPEGVGGPSQVVDADAYAWRHREWRGRRWEETVIQELHVGLLGGYDGVREHLPRLAALGVTALELMPLAAFDGERNWGYDGVLPFAPHHAYGTPDALRELVDAAHGHGLMVLLDVVYNHFGPSGNHLARYAPGFFRDDVHTPWGSAIDFRQPPVREFFIANALCWLQDFRFDGLRLDAVHAIVGHDWLEELAGRIAAAMPADRHVHLVLENDDNDAALLRSGYRAQWNDDAHHVLHVALTGEREGYYGDYGDSVADDLARWLGEGFVYQGQPSAHRGGAPRGSPSGDLPPTAFVAFLQNHDQIGNRAFGERIAALAAPQPLRAATTLLLLSPQIPLLFMGEEWASRRPFLYFTDYAGELAAAVREGRRREFARFSAFADPATRERIPDPNDAATFAASTPDVDALSQGEHAAHHAFVAALLRRRHRDLVPRLAGTRSEGATAHAPAAASAAWRMGDGSRLRIDVNLGDAATSVPLAFAGAPLHAEGVGADDIAHDRLPPWSCLVRLAPA